MSNHETAAKTASCIEKPEQKTREQKFVEHAIRNCRADRGYAAKMRKALGDSAEDQAWGLLAPWIDLGNPRERLPYALVGGMIGLAKPEKDGSIPLGEAIWRSGKTSGDHNERRLRRLLACNGVKDACETLAPILKLIVSRNVGISWSSLLADLMRYGRFTGYGKSPVREIWAQEFYSAGFRSAREDMEAEHEE